MDDRDEQGLTADAQLQAAADALADSIEVALPRWVEDSVERVYTAWAGSACGELRDQAEGAGVAARDAVVPEIRALLSLDPDEQRSTPLELLRGATRFPTGLLHAHGVPPVARDTSAEARFPDDVYDLTISAFADLGPMVHECGLTWGAGKAFVHLTRRRADGQR